MSSTTAPAPTHKFIPPPQDRLLYGGGLLGWSFLTVFVAGLFVLGYAIYSKRAKAKELAPATYGQHQQWRLSQLHLGRQVVQDAPGIPGGRRGARRVSDVEMQRLSTSPQRLSRMPRAEVRCPRLRDHEVPRYEDVVKDEERRKAFARLTGGEEIGQAR